MGIIVLFRLLVRERFASCLEMSRHRIRVHQSIREEGVDDPPRQHRDAAFSFTRPSGRRGVDRPHTMT